MCIRPSLVTFSTDACDVGPPAKRRSLTGAAASHVKETRPSDVRAPAVVPKAQRAPSLRQGRARAPARSLGRGGLAAPVPSSGPAWGIIKPELENQRVAMATQRRLNNIVVERLVLLDRIAVLEALILALDNEERRMSGGRLSRWRDSE